VRLLAIRLLNFRQFRGDQTFKLASDADRRVALLFGANGSGKTTLLNAFTWALYGKLSDDVESQERILTDSLWAETAFGVSIPVEVDVTFEHEGREYHARRSAQVRKAGDAQSTPVSSLKLWLVERDGSSKEEGAPQEKIESILPQRLSRFFFFNGERIEKLVSRRAYAEVKEDIKTLLGIEHVERALKHLPAVDRKLSAELKRHGGEKAAGIQTSIDDVQDQCVALKDEIAELESRSVEFGSELGEVLDLLRQHEGAGPLQSQRDGVVTDLLGQRNELDRLLNERRYRVATKGFIAFTADLADQTLSKADALHERGSLPAPLKRDFVESLLQQAECICGTPLTDGSSATRHVQEWRAKAGLAEVEAAWQRLRGDAEGLSAARQDLREALDDFGRRISELRDEISRNEERQTVLDGQLKDLPLEDVQRLEAKRRDLEGLIKTTEREVGAKKQALATAEAELESLRGELNRAAVMDELAIKARERLQLVQSVTQALTEILEIRSEDMRERLDRKVKEVFAEITIKPYFPVLNEDFELGLFQQTQGGEVLPVPKSTGESQILSLSFVAAVSELAREVRVERHVEGELHADAGHYPIVMDAAFGSLDENYQGAVARALARMAPQMVVLVSKSQGMGEVIRELAPHISQLGVITSHTTNQEDKSEVIELEGREYPYVLTRDESDWAEIRVVR